jgi:hypothetical protein
VYNTGVKLQFSAQIDGVIAKKDRTLSVKLGTQELTADDSSYLLDCMGKQLWVGIAETPIESLEVPEVLPEMQGEKTPAQRLRSILYILWSTKTDKKETFPRFYENYIFKLCENIKSKLE